MTYRHSLAVSALAFAASRAMTAQPLFGPQALRGLRIAFGPDDDSGQKSVADLAKEIKTDFEAKHDKVKEIAEKALAEAQKGVPLAETAKELADQAITAMNEAKSRLDEMEQKMVRGGGDGDRPDRRSLGERFTDDERIKAFLANQPSSGRADMRVKATITTATTDAAGSVGEGIRPNVLAGIEPYPTRELTIRNLLSPGRTDGPSITYMRKTGFTNNAAPVAEGAAKPQSDLQIEAVNTTTKVIAHFEKVSRQALSDVPQLRSLIDEDLITGLQLIEEAQILNGDGTGQNLHGIIPQATAYSAPFIPADDNGEIDQVRLMILQASLALYPASGIVMHPTDWARFELTKDGNGNYIIGNPQGSIEKRLWSLPVVTSMAMTVDKVLVGAFRRGAQLFDQWDARVELGFVNDDFTKNLVTLLGEERLALAVKIPEAFIYGDLGNV